MDHNLSLRSASPQNAAQFLRHFLIDEMGRLIKTKGQPFLKFFPLISGMEFLGACYDEHPFEDEKLCKQRFKKTICLMGGKYKMFDGSQKQKYPCLYEDFRCPMVHQFRAGTGKFKLTAVQSSPLGDNIRKKHLTKLGCEYIIVLEELFEDFSSTVLQTIRKIENEEWVISKLLVSHVIIEKMDFFLTT